MAKFVSGVAAAIIGWASGAGAALAGEIKIIHAFAGGAEGRGPSGPLATDGFSLYGTAISRASGAPRGEIFQLSLNAAAAWQVDVLYTFPANDPPNPGLILGHDGALYGSTLYGGPGFAGTVFRLVPPSQGTVWTYQLLYTFPSVNGASGGHPSGRLLMPRAGEIFGVAQSGGGTFNGVAYELSAPAGGLCPGPRQCCIVSAIRRMRVCRSAG